MSQRQERLEGKGVRGVNVLVDMKKWGDVDVRVKQKQHNNDALQHRASIEEGKGMKTTRPNHSVSECRNQSKAQKGGDVEKKTNTRALFSPTPAVGEDIDRGQQRKKGEGMQSRHTNIHTCAVSKQRRKEVEWRKENKHTCAVLANTGGEDNGLDVAAEDGHVGANVLGQAVRVHLERESAQLLALLVACGDD